MFWKKKPKGKDLADQKSSLNFMANQVLGASMIEFDRASLLEQALVGTFLFGMIYADGMIHQLSAPEVHALALGVFKDVLHYSDQAAAQAIQECINATAPGYHDTMNAILHRGIDGHKQFISGDTAGLAENLQSILQHFRK